MSREKDMINVCGDRRQKDNVLIATAAASTSTSTTPVGSMSSSGGNRTEEWDAVIIGSGVGGLTTATQLASKGAKVLVLEK